jgi:hypothetical protein
MSATLTKEYKVLLTHYPQAEPEGQQEGWRATILGFPYIVEEASSREQALNQLKAKLDEITRNSEVVTLTAPVLPLPENGTEDEPAAQGWNDHGLFREEREALQLFDEIEEARNRDVVGGE